MNPLTAAARIVFPDRDPDAVTAGELESRCLDWLGERGYVGLAGDRHGWSVNFFADDLSPPLETSSRESRVEAIARAILAVAERTDALPPKDTP